MVIYCPSCEERVASLYCNHNMCITCFRSYLKDKIEDLLTDIDRFEKRNPDLVQKASTEAILKELEKENARVFPAHWSPTIADPSHLWELVCMLLPKEKQTIGPYTVEIEQEEEEKEPVVPLFDWWWSLNETPRQDMRLRNAQNALLKKARIGKHARRGVK